MFEIPFHPKLVHLPLGTSVVVPLVLFGLMLAIWRKWLPERTWWLGAFLTVFVVASGGLALKSGELDEERVERVVGEAAIERHEEAAVRFMFGAGITAALAVAAALLRGPGLQTALRGVTSIGACVTLALGIRAGQLGGELVYRHGAAKAYVSPTATGGGGTTRPAEAEGDD